VTDEPTEATIELPAVQRLEVVKVRPGDTILVHADKVPPASAAEMGAHLRKVWPDNQIVILADGVTIEVHRPAAAS
jgi:hypothetical protein